MQARERIIGAILGSAVGDALGVPVEFSARDWLRENPVASMQGGGPHHQTPGTWSDDTSLTLASIDSLLTGFDLPDMMNRFLRWLKHAEYTARGKVFDVGNATRSAIYRWEDYGDPATCGGREESDNGNGSLMRILPVALYGHLFDSATAIRLAMDASAITHAHPRSCLACAYYALVVRELMSGNPLLEAIGRAAEGISRIIPPEERESFRDLLDLSFLERGEENVLSGGYVMHTLEAALWCVHRTSGYRNAALRAVNLGCDTDTTATVAGGIAGLIYGEKSIPTEWLAVLARSDDIRETASRFADNLTEKQVHVRAV